MAHVQRHLQKVSAGERGAKAMCDGWSGGGDGAVQRGEHVLPLLRRREGGGEGGGPELLTSSSKDLAALVCVSEGSENRPRCRSKARVKICWPDIVTL